MNTLFQAQTNPTNPLGRPRDYLDFRKVLRTIFSDSGAPGTSKFACAFGARFIFGVFALFRFFFKSYLYTVSLPKKLASRLVASLVTTEKLPHKNADMKQPSAEVRLGRLKMIGHVPRQDRNKHSNIAMTRAPEGKGKGYEQI